MVIKQSPFQQIDWSETKPELHPGTSGTASWKIFNMGDIRVRIVEFSATYEADHWCNKGHVVYCIDGEMTTFLEDGSEFVLSAGKSWFVGDDSDAHCIKSEKGCTIFIVD